MKITLDPKLTGEPAYIATNATGRGTWLNLLLWCAEQENGGIIKGAALWSSEAWGRLGVVKECLPEAGRLLLAIGGDIQVLGYPREQEEYLKRARDLGRQGGLTKAGKIVNKSRVPTSTPSRVPTRVPIQFKQPSGDLEAIYQAYPRRIAKTNALAAIRKVVASGISADLLLEKTQQFAAATAKWGEGDKKFIPHPATWFNRGSYDDDPKTWIRSYVREGQRPATTAEEHAQGW